LFHALRPLTLVVDTASLSLNQYIRQLTAATACRILEPRPTESADLATAAGRAVPVIAAARPERATVSGFLKPASARRTETPRTRRLAWLSEQVPAERADFGVWIDGDGEACWVVDDRGRVVAPDRLLAAMARLECAGQHGATIVAEHSTASRSLAAIQAAGIHVTTSAPQREAMFRTLEHSGAAIGGGPSGRFWFAGPAPAADGLALLAWLLNLLSRADRPLSVVLDAAGTLG
jgi:phosphomannomutase